MIYLFSLLIIAMALTVLGWAVAAEWIKWAFGYIAKFFKTFKK